MRRSIIFCSGLSSFSVYSNPAFHITVLFKRCLFFLNGKDHCTIFTKDSPSVQVNRKPEHRIRKHMHEQTRRRISTETRISTFENSSEYYANITSSDSEVLAFPSPHHYQDLYLFFFYQISVHNEKEYILEKK